MHRIDFHRAAERLPVLSLERERRLRSLLVLNDLADAPGERGRAASLAKLHQRADGRTARGGNLASGHDVKGGDVDVLARDAAK